MACLCCRCSTCSVDDYSPNASSFFSLPVRPRLRSHHRRRLPPGSCWLTSRLGRPVPVSAGLPPPSSRSKTASRTWALRWAAVTPSCCRATTMVPLASVWASTATQPNRQASLPSASMPDLPPALHQHRLGLHQAHPGDAQGAGREHPPGEGQGESGLGLVVDQLVPGQLSTDRLL